MNLRITTAIVAAASAVTLISLAGCSAAPMPSPAVSTNEGPAGDIETILSTQGLSGLSPRQVVEALDQDPAARPLPLMASVRYNEVQFDDGTTKATLPLGEDDFYISVAPYESYTHDCYFHSLGTCQGELTNEDVHVTVVTDDGETLLDDDASTYANGFVGFWVPKDVKGTVTVTKDGKTGQVAFSSDAEGATCITTLKLV